MSGKGVEVLRNEFRTKYTINMILWIVVATWLAFLTFTSMAPIRVQPDSAETAGFLAKRVKELQSRIDQLMTQSAVVRETKRHIQSPSTVDQSWRFWPGATYLEALPNCQTLKCIREAHRLLPKRNISYNFPHFFIAGYSKSASTSIYQFLNTHPEILPPHEKEPILFSDMCSYDRGKMDCPYGKQREYIHDILKVQQYVDSGGSLAPYQATPRIMDLGVHFAEILREYMPWLKLISSMREPISRSMSKYIMAKDKFESGCLMNHTMVFCLRRDREKLFGNPKNAYYSRPLKAWLDNFPRDQLLLVQYEKVVAEDTQQKELSRIKKFIGINPSLNEDTLDFGRVNCRHCTINPDGWPMKEKVYRKLIELVMPDVLEIVRLIDLFDLGNGTQWFDTWAKVWDDNLSRCVNGFCNITLS
ncbi:hypothetical protein M9435_004735 [Picochlorum sp. BPE23]|nr:hypothetical protein M9435_004735 [Picochlorum sp. BPE23]